MNPAPLVISLAPQDADLRDEIVQEIAEYADMRTAPPVAGPYAQLVIDVIDAGFGIPGSIVAVLTMLRSLQAQKQAEGRMVPLAIGQLDSPPISLEKSNDDVLSLLMEQVIGPPIPSQPEAKQPTSPKTDLEAQIRASYTHIRQLQKHLRSTTDVQEQERARQEIATEQEQIQVYQKQYVQLCKSLDTEMAEDIAAIAIIIDFEFSGKR